MYYGQDPDFQCEHCVAVYRRSGAGGLDDLTARELEIARLVVDRLTNAQIAETLFLSKKTVETHLRNIFAKAAVSSRVELARAVERADRDRGATAGERLA